MSTLLTDNLSVEVDRHLLLKDVSLTFEAQRLHLIVGPNGAGKSTLLKAMLGLIEPHHGEVRVAQQAVHRMNSSVRAKHLSYMPQHLEMVFQTRVVDFLELSRFAFDEAPQNTHQLIDRSLAAVAAAHLKYADFHTLSGGERQRVMLAACLTQQAPFILLDEPDASLDPAHQIALKQLIGTILQAGLYTVILVTHHWNPYLDLDPHIHALKDGRHHFSCDRSQLHQRLSQLYHCEFVALQVGQQSWSLPKYS